MNLKQLLEGRLKEEVLKEIPRAFDQVGDIAIIKLPESLMENEEVKKEIAFCILKSHKHIKSVFLKKGEVSGKFRVAKHEYVLGENKTETVHKEYGCRYKLDINKVYFNFRLGNERYRIAKQVREGEKVLVMFAGIGCFAIAIAKHSKPSLVVAVELNPDAFAYLKENIELNKVGDKVIAVEGDVREKVPEIVEKYGKFDRILMPLPKDASSFLDLAKLASKENAIIHFYTFAKSEEEAVKNIGEEVEIIKIVRCGEYAPFVFRFCIDFKFKHEV